MVLLSTNRPPHTRISSLSLHDALPILEEDGKVSLYVGSSAVGQGVETILTQIAADAMELPFEAFKVFHGSTTYVKEGWGSYRSEEHTSELQSHVNGVCRLLLENKNRRK